MRVLPVVLVTALLCSTAVAQSPKVPDSVQVDSDEVKYPLGVSFYGGFGSVKGPAIGFDLSVGSYIAGLDFGFVPRSQKWVESAHLGFNVLPTGVGAAFLALKHTGTFESLVGKPTTLSLLSANLGWHSGYHHTFTYSISAGPGWQFARHDDVSTDTFIINADISLGYVIR